MKINESQRALVDKWIAEKWKGSGECPVCQQSKQPPVKTGGILEFKQSLSAVFFALHLNILSYRRLTYPHR